MFMKFNPIEVIKIFCSFEKFAIAHKNTIDNFKYVRCRECVRKEACDIVERYKDGTYQPKHNHYYWEDYGCYQIKYVKEGKEK